MSSGSWPSHSCTDQPAAAKRCLLVGDVGEADLAVDRDAVVVPHHDQPVQPLLAGEADRLVADPLHQAAVAGDDPSAVVDDLAPEAGGKALLGDRHADGVPEPLAERPGRRLDPGRVPVLGMALGARAELAEPLDLVDRHVAVAGQVQEPVEQHRPVPGRQHEAVAVRPRRRARIELQVLLEQDGRHVGHPHRHSRMPGIRLLHRVHRQHPERGRLHPVVGETLAEHGDVHRGGLSCTRGARRTSVGRVARDWALIGSPPPRVKAARAADPARTSCAPEENHRKRPIRGRDCGARFCARSCAGTDCIHPTRLPKTGGTSSKAHR